MKRLAVAAVLCVAAVGMIGLLTGCDGGGSSGGSPAAGLNATGFWEDPLNGQTAAGDLVQNGGASRAACCFRLRVTGSSPARSTAIT